MLSPPTRNTHTYRHEYVGVRDVCGTLCMIWNSCERFLQQVSCMLYLCRADTHMCAQFSPLQSTAFHTYDKQRHTRIASSTGSFFFFKSFMRQGLSRPGSLSPTSLCLLLSHTHTRVHTQCTGVPTATSLQCHAQHANTARASRHDHQKERGVGEEGEGGRRQTRSRVHGEVGHLPVKLKEKGQRVAKRPRQ